MHGIYENTTARKKTVLIIEDHEGQRLALHMALKRRGFRVESAGNVAKARELAEKLGKELDVMILDMRLEDPEAPNLTGADLGIEVRSRQFSWPPEFLINSAYEEVDYYRLALRLGAAAYLRKEELDHRRLVNKEELDHYRLVRHVRVLSLRRALSIERPDSLENIRKIAETSRSQSEAITKFCQEVLAPEFAGCLGAPFALLLTDGKGTRCCSSSIDLPEGPTETYETLQALAQGKIDIMEPFVLEPSKLKMLKDRVDENVLRKFEGAAFLPPSIKIMLSPPKAAVSEGLLNRDIHLSFAILKEDRSKNPLAEDPVELTKVLAQYLRPTVIEHLLHLLSQWTEISSRRKSVMKATSQFCLYVGQQMKSLLSGFATPEPERTIAPSLRGLYDLASELHQTGENLMTIVGNGETLDSENVKELRRPVSMAEIIRLAAEELADQLPEDAINIQGDCTIDVIPEDFYSASSRLLQWFANRTIESGKSALISIACMATHEGPRVVFEDQSRKLSKQLRRQLFDPFTQAASLPTTSGGQSLPSPLYLAKTFVETRNGGVLEDMSDQISGDIGHRFVMKFPPPDARLHT